MRKPLSIIAAATAGALLFASQAAAHAHLVASNPAANASVAAPKAIVLTFSEKLVPAFSGFELTMPEHKMKVAVKTSVSDDGKTITGIPSAALTPGAYTITWRAATADGHRMDGTVAFKVG